MTEKESMGKIINHYFIQGVNNRLRALRSCLRGGIIEPGYYPIAEDEEMIQKEYKLVRKAWEEGIKNIEA